MPTPLPGVPWTGPGVDDMTTDIAARNAAAAEEVDIEAAVQAVVDGSPAALDTLNELAAALGDDANYAATVTAALAGKAPLPGAWVAPTLLNSWTNFGSGYRDARVRLNGSTVEIEGLIGGGADGSVAFILPPGMRPGYLARMILDCVGGIGVAIVDTSGNVTINSVGGSVLAFAGFDHVGFSIL